MESYLTKDELEFYNSLTPQQVASYISALYKIPRNTSVTDIQLYNALNQQTVQIANLLSRQLDVKSVTPSILGKQAEDSFEQICKMLPDNYRVINTASAGKKGDFIIYYSKNGREYSCCVDIKNYTKKVPRDEVEKFYTDIYHGNYDCALLVSTNTQVIGIPDAIYKTYASTASSRVPVWFISGVSNEVILQVIQCMFQDIVDKVHTPVSTASLSSINFALSYLADIRRAIKDLIDSNASQLSNMNKVLVDTEYKISCELTKLGLRSDSFDLIDCARPFDKPITLIQLNSKLRTNYTIDEITDYCTRNNLQINTKGKTTYYHLDK
jgi:hypothetical protein